TGEATQNVALGAVIHADDVTVREFGLAVTTLQGPRGLGPFIGFDAGHFARQVHSFEAVPMRGGPLQVLDIVTAVRGEGEAALGAPRIGDPADQARRADAGYPEEIATLRRALHGVPGPPVGGRRDGLAKHETATSGRARLDVLVVRPHVPDMREGEG